MLVTSLRLGLILTIMSNNSCFDASSPPPPSLICLLICFVEQNVYGWGVLGILLNAHDINLICIDVFVVNALEWVRVMIIVRANFNKDLF